MEELKNPRDWIALLKIARALRLSQDEADILLNQLINPQ